MRGASGSRLGPAPLEEFRPQLVAPLNPSPVGIMKVGKLIRRAIYLREVDPVAAGARRRTASCCVHGTCRPRRATGPFLSDARLTQKFRPAPMSWEPPSHAWERVQKCSHICSPWERFSHVLDLLPCHGSARSHDMGARLPCVREAAPMRMERCAPMMGASLPCPWEHRSHAWEHPPSPPMHGSTPPMHGSTAPMHGSTPSLMGAPLPCMGAVLPCTWERRSHGMGAGSGAPRSHAWEGATAPISAPMSTELSAIRPCRWPCRISSPRAPRVSSRTEVNTRSVLAWEVKKSGKANTDAVTVLPCTRTCACLRRTTHSSIDALNRWSTPEPHADAQVTRKKVGATPPPGAQSRYAKRM